MSQYIKKAEEINQQSFRRYKAGRLPVQWQHKSDHSARYVWFITYTGYVRSSCSIIDPLHPKIWKVFTVREWDVL